MTLPIAAATATVRSVSTRSCCRHSRRNSAPAQRASARRAAHRRFAAAPRRAGERLSSSPVAGREQRLGAGRSDRLIDDVAVAEEDDAVGPRRELRVVRHDDSGHAALLAARSRRMTASPLTESSAPVGSSASSRPAVADDRPGDRDPLSLAAGELVGEAVGALGDVELLEGLQARRARGLRPTPSSSSGSATFSTAVSPASRLKSWKT